MRNWRILVLALALTDCQVGANVPATAEVYCTLEEECPKDWSCLAFRCIPPNAPLLRCGDGILNRGEECDCGDSAAAVPSACIGSNSDVAPNRCRTTCKLPVCGDGGLDSDEECDDGNLTSADGCSESCLREVCGNSRLDPGEACDDGNAANGDGCSPDCLSDESCGNGYIDLAAGETCDCGVAPVPLPIGCVASNSDIANSACRLNCTRQRCGDGIVDLGEECDCGDASIALPGGCSSPNGNSVADGCRSNCLANYCGDGVVDSDETCDDGNSTAGDGCNPDCITPCGNGILNEPIELCDTAPPPNKTCFDYGFNQGDLTCSPTCTPDFSTCGTIGWRSAASNTLANLRSVWADPSGIAWAVGEGPTGAAVSYFDGTSWEEIPDHPAVDGTFLLGRGVWGTAPNNVIVATEQTKFYHWDGNDWTKKDFGLISLGDCVSLWGADANNVWAACGDWVMMMGGTVLKYDGTDWVQVHGAGLPFNSIWGSAADDIWAVALNFGIFDLHHETGSGWARDGAASAVSNNAGTIALCGTGRNDVWGVGMNSSFIHYDGLTWTTYDPSPDPPPVSGALLSCWAAGPDDVWASGSGGSVVHYDGANWSAVSSDTEADLYSIWGTRPDEIWAVGDDGAIVRYNGSSFVVVNPGEADDGELSDLWGPTAHRLWMTGTNYNDLNRSIFGYDQTWLSMDTTGGAWFESIWGSGPRDIWAYHAGGTYGDMWHFDGTSWTEHTSLSANWQGISGTSPSDVWAVGTCDSRHEFGCAHRFISSWVEATLPVVPALRDVSAVSSDDVWAVGDAGTILHYDGAWSAVSSPTTQRLNGVWVSEAGVGWAVGYDGTLVRFDGSSWQLYDSSPNPPVTIRELTAVWGSDPNEVWAVGKIGTILHNEGGRWLSVENDGTADLRGVFGADGIIHFVGRDATIIRLDHRTPWTCRGTETCDNGIDDDCDGGADCLDSDCAADSACQLCADGTSEQVFRGGMHGCGGSVAYAARASLCAGGATVCSAQDWVERRGSRTPALNYWTDEPLQANGSSGNCFVSLSTTDGSCASSASMPVCGMAQDALGNLCTWLGCGFEATAPVEYFGGCGSATTAGALCCR